MWSYRRDPDTGRIVYARWDDFRRAGWSSAAIEYCREAEIAQLSRLARGRRVRVVRRPDE